MAEKPVCLRDAVRVEADTAPSRRQASDVKPAVAAMSEFAGHF